jgi:hypothetical protein
VAGLIKDGMMRRVEGKLIGLLAATACGLLGACSHSSGDGGTPLVKRHSPGAPGSSGAANTADTGPTDLVSAVSGGGGEGRVGLKFQLGQRPVSGQPLVITLRLTANQALDHLDVHFRADDGLELTQGADFDPPGQMEEGATVDHSLTLIPAHEGVYTVMATVTVGTAAEGVSHSFVIPVVVGAPVAAEAVEAKPAGTAKPTGAAKAR